MAEQQISTQKGINFGIPNVEPALLREKALSFVRSNGPVLPLQIAKHLSTNTIFAGAILSELISAKHIFVTHATIGSSPLYYIKGQEEKLGPSLYNYLKQKEKQAYDKIKESKIIRESEAEPWQRVAMRDLKDFCFPLTVTIDQEKIEIFWKFYLVSEEEAKNLISSMLKKEEPIEPIKEIVKEEAIKEEKQDVIQEISKQVIEKPIKKPFVKQKLEQTQLQEIKEIVKDKALEKDKFYNYVKEFCSKNNIQISEEFTISKNKEFDFIAKIPSNIGLITYYIKAKNKKSINEGDVSLAFSESQFKNLPCLFLTTGKLNKKASLLLDKKFQNVILRQI